MKEQRKIKHIIWDWNGTLLNDSHVCIEAINVLLDERSLPKLDLDRYQEIFTFPVKEYYTRAGFDLDKEPFSVPAHQFMDLYRERITRATLHPGVTQLITELNRSYRQYILSAMEKNLLADLLGHFGIRELFTGVYGIDDHYANGKERWAERLIRENDIAKDEVLLIGDTLHDHEVASHVNIPCVLVANGHQSHSRLKASGRKIVSSLSEIPPILEEMN